MSIIWRRAIAIVFGICGALLVLGLSYGGESWQSIGYRMTVCVVLYALVGRE